MDAFKAQTDLITKIGENNAHFIWVLGLLLQESDLESLASESLTDGSDDKKIDFIHLDRDEGRLVIAQGYFSSTKKDTAPANKASDLNTAVAWLFSGDVSAVPKELKAAIDECRTALNEGEISSIHLFYIHNLPESINVSRELQTVLTHLRKFIDTASITSNAKEIGAPQIEHLFSSQESHIEVTEEQICPSKIGFYEKGPEWDAAVFSVPGAWLNNLFNKHGDALFSANYRGFLGFSRRRKINKEIRSTAETDPSDFWVYNNGVTILTLGFSEVSAGTRLTGISIINGAQTTGAVGNVNLSNHDIRDLRVMCRVIQCRNPDKIGKIVKYNNTQNEITTWDQYSRDPEQSRIEAEFKELGYSYERKRCFRPVADSISIEDVAQPLAAFGGRYDDANRGRNRIFERSTTYKATFDGKKARHILFVYSLSRAIDERRLALKQKTGTSGLISLEEQQLTLLRNLRFKFFFLSILAKTLESITGRRIDVGTVAYSPDAAKVANNSLTALVAAALPPVTSVLTMVCTQVRPENLSEQMAKNGGGVEEIARTVSGLIYSANVSGQFSQWAETLS